MLKKIISASVVYTMLSFFQPLLSLLLQPIYLNWFSNEDYALFSLMNSYSSFVTLISALGIGGGVFTFYYDYHHNKEELDRYIGNVLTFCIWTIGIFSLLIFPFGNFLFSILFTNNDSILFYPYGAIATIGGISAAIVTPFIVFLRNGNNLFAYVTLILITALGGFIGQLVFIVLFKAGITGALWGKTIGSVFGATLVIVKNRKQLFWKPDWSYLKNTLEFMKFSTPASVFAWMYMYVDRFLIERMLNMLLLSVYSLLHVLTSTIELASYAVKNAITPFVFAKLKESETEGTPVNNISIYRFYYLFIVLFASTVVVVVTNIHWLTSNIYYHSIATYVFLYASGYIIGSLIEIGNIYIYYEKKSPKLLMYGLFSISLNVGLIIFLVPVYQVWGVVLASFFARFFTFFAYFIPHRKLLRIFFTRRELALFLLVFMVFAIAHWATVFQFISIGNVGIIQFFIVAIIIISLNRSIPVQVYRFLNSMINFRMQ